MKSKTLAEAIRYARKLKGWSQGELARESHVSVRTIVDIEGSKQVAPRKDVVIRLAHSLNQNIGEYLKLANYPDEMTDDMLKRALERQVKSSKRLAGSDTVAKVEDLNFLEALMAQSSDKPLTFFDLYELLCRFRSRI